MKRFKTAIDKTRDICYNKNIIKKKGIDENVYVKRRFYKKRLYYVR